MDLGPHAGFIIASYAVCFGVVAALVVWVRTDKARLDKTLAELAERGLSRASKGHQTPDQQ